MEITKEEIERLSMLRNSMMSPYVAQGWDIKADYPQERRLVLKKNKKFIRSQPLELIQKTIEVCLLHYNLV